MFYCDPTFAKYYDELMGLVDPNANHVSWLFEISDGKLPSKIADIGAGTGRVAEQLIGNSPSISLCAIEPNEVLYDFLLKKGIAASKQTIQEHSQVNVEHYRLAFMTYGCLQYVPDIVTLNSNLKAVYKILAPGGKFAGEFFATEVYSNLDEELNMPIMLGGEPWDLSMKVKNLDGGLLEVVSTISGNLVQSTGEMIEVVYPLSDHQCYELFESAGFDEVHVVRSGAYHRCVGVKY